MVDRRVTVWMAASMVVIAGFWLLHAAVTGRVALEPNLVFFDDYRYVPGVSRWLDFVIAVPVVINLRIVERIGNQDVRVGLLLGGLMGLFTSLGIWLGLSCLLVLPASLVFVGLLERLHVPDARHTQDYFWALNFAASWIVTPLLVGFINGCLLAGGYWLLYKLILLLLLLRKRWRL